MGIGLRLAMVLAAAAALAMTTACEDRLGTIVLRGDEAMLAGDPEAAITHYDRALEIADDAPSIYNRRGLARQELGDHDLALEDFNKTIELQPDHAAARSNAAVSLLEQERPHEAIAFLDEAIMIDPQEMENYIRRARAHIALGDRSAAEEDVAAAIDRGASPNRAEAVLQ